MKRTCAARITAMGYRANSSGHTNRMGLELQIPQFISSDLQNALENSRLKKVHSYSQTIFQWKKRSMPAITHHCMKYLKYVLIFFSYLPLYWLLLLYSFTVKAWIKLGHFPIPSTNDPKYMGFDGHYRSIWYLFPILVYSCIPYLCAQFLFKKSAKEKLFTTHTVMYFTGCVLIAIQLLLDPFEIIYWYLD